MRAPLGLVSAAGFVPLAQAEQYQSAMIGLKVTLPHWGSILGANLHHGNYDLAANPGLRVASLGVGIKQPIGNFTVGAQWAMSEFRNFTGGRDTAVVLGADYRFSPRTSLYSRLGHVQDRRGRTVGGLSGGPSALLVPMGIMEVPTYAGAGLQPDASMSIFSIGLRHQF